MMCLKSIPVWICSIAGLLGYRQLYKLPADGRSVMQAQQTGLPQPRFCLAIILVCWSTIAVLAQSSSVSQQNAGTADFDIAARSAAAAQEAGHGDEAIQEYRRALAMNPGWGEGWWNLGTLLYDGDHYAEAIPAFQKVVDLAPSAGPAWNFLGLCEFETKDYANSLEHLQKGLTLGDDDPEIGRVSKYHLALLLIRSGESDQAAALLVSTFGQSEMAPQIKIALGLATLRVPLLPKEIDPSRDALIYATGEAASAMAQGNLAKALAAFPPLLKDYPGTPYLHYAYGKALASAGRDEEALKRQHEEASISPKSALPWIEISQLELRLQHPQDALHAAEEAVELAPDSPVSHRTMGELLQAVGKKQKAAAELALAEKVAPEKSRPEERIARLYSSQTAAQSEGNLQTGARTSSEPGSGPGLGGFDELSSRAAAAQAAGNLDQAIQNYQRALQLRPEWDDGRWSLAMLHYSAGHYPEAISELKNWMEHHPNVGAAWAVMGLCEFETKDYNNALIHLQRGEDLGLGGNPEAEGLARYHLAVLQNRNGQFETAMETLLPGALSGTVASEIQIALGMALLRMPSLPDQLEPSQSTLVRSAGEITALLLNSKYDQAFPKFQALLKEYPSVPFLHYAYGMALVALSQFDEAKIQLRAESQISPRSELPYISLASVALKQDSPTEALASAERAVELAPDSSESHYVLGRAYLELGQTEQAVLEFERASKLAPGSPKVHFNLAKAYAKAKLPEKAEQERAIFARLNALAEQQRSRSGNQAYGRSHDAVELAPARSETEAATPQHP
ncbi:MAG TPA: tetratricopeptide repeat protein [Terriglobales bacterium]|jgi:tetratricopeptide (TPR) repeat protein|nr:tetratricopeptide repeat protein [Terriglobales bacterium]